MKLLKKKKSIFIFFFMFLTFLFFILTTHKSNIICSKYGDFVFDKLLNFSSDCYERSLKGVVYPLEKFLGPRYNVVKNKKSFKCPSNSPIIILTGQSNAANFLRNYKEFSNYHFNYFDGNCYELSSPTLGAEGEMSSLAPAIAKKIISKDKFIFITSGRGGIPIQDASIIGDNFIKYNIDALNFLKTNQNFLKYFIWIHGEANNGNSSDYMTKFERMFKHITKTNQNVPFLIITETSVCNNSRDKKLNTIQKKISKKYTNLSTNIQTDDLLTEYRYDNCHFNEMGIDKISDRISKLINDLESE